MMAARSMQSLQYWIDHPEEHEKGGSQKTKMMAARSMQSLQYWIDHPEEHEKEIQRMIHAGETEHQRKARFLQSALQNGTYTFMGKKERIFDKLTRENLEGLWQNLRNGGGEIRPYLGPRTPEEEAKMNQAKKPTTMLQLEGSKQPIEEHLAMEYQAFIAAVDDIKKA